MLGVSLTYLRYCAMYSGYHSCFLKAALLGSFHFSDCCLLLLSSFEGSSNYQSGHMVSATNELSSIPFHTHVCSRLESGGPAFANSI